jgi:SAM-dependent methyltransferase
MAFFNQHPFPKLFQIFQIWGGGTHDKQMLVLDKYNGQKRILEVGCSIGNIAQAFRFFENIEYTGIDIDPVVIEHAKESFSQYPNFEFICQDLKTYQFRGQPFDFILFAGVCHHVPDEECQNLFKAALKLLSNNGKFVIVDILKPEPEDSWFLHWYITIDQGEHIRSDASLRALIQGVSKLKDAEIHYVGSSPYSRPLIARFGVYTLS